MQFVLQPGHKLTIDMNSLCWCSNSLVLQSRGLFLARLLSTSIAIGDAINETTSPAILSLNQVGSGKILVLKPVIPIYCFKDSFICATEEVTVNPRVLPFDLSLTTIGIPHLFNKAHYCSSSSIGHANSNEGKIFLQSGGSILIKELKSGESLIIKFHCMVAFEETCKISIVNPFRNIVLLFGGKDTFLKIVGPGKIFFCAHSFSRKAMQMRSRLEPGTSIQSNMSVLGFCLYVLAVSLSFYSLTLMINMVALQIDQVYI